MFLINLNGILFSELLEIDLLDNCQRFSPIQERTIEDQALWSYSRMLHSIDKTLVVWNIWNTLES